MNNINDMMRNLKKIEIYIKLNKETQEIILD